MNEKKTLTWTSASRSDVGKKRKLNEDSYLDRPEERLWTVADGMGGHSSGDVASQSIVKALADVPGNPRFSQFVDAVEESVIAVNAKLVELAAEGGANNTIGSTVVSLLGSDRHCLCMWAGDSRIYRLRDRKLRQLTQDHTQAELMIAQGMLSRVDAATHASSNMVTRAVGASPDIYLDMDIFNANAGDRYLVCSDGLDKHVTDPEIGQLLIQGTAEESVNALIELTLERGAVDNVTIIVIDAN